MSKPYNAKYQNDDTISEDIAFTTALSLSKKTFVQIDTIKEIVNIKSRSNIITSAVDFYYAYLTSDDYITDIQNKQRTIKSYE